MNGSRWTLVASSLALACAPAHHGAAAPAPAVLPAAGHGAENPFFRPSTLPYHVPPFDRIHDSDFEPAFEKGMQEQRKEIEAIAHDAAPPTFENTIVAMEKTGRLLTRVEKTFLNLNMSNTDDAMEKLESEMAPRLAAHEDAILLDPALFARVDALWHHHRQRLGLDPESAQLLDRYEEMFVRAGARLSDADKDTLKAINAELSSLNTRFRQNVLRATKDGAVVVDDARQLDGLSPEQIGAAAEAAKARGLAGKWVVSLQNTTAQPLLEQMKDRTLRERVHEASIRRADGGPSDNTSVVARLVALRARKAILLGYRNWAAYALADETARTPRAVNDMLSCLAKVALAKARRDAADIQALIGAEAKAAHHEPFRLQPWDWTFYEAQVRERRYHFTDGEVKPYFEMNRVLTDGVFYAAHQLYGLRFDERQDVPVYQKDVRVFDVIDADGSALGLLLLDYYRRDNKQGGAWMGTFVDPSTLLDRKSVVINNLNVPKPPAGQPALLTFDDVIGMFHEFGHALHALLSHARYPLLSGTTNLPPDFVEYPSQLNEAWAREPSVLAHYARHYRTGEPMPKILFDEVVAAQNFNSGYATTEYLKAAMLDQAWHQIGAGAIPPPSDVMPFERAALAKDDVLYPLIPPRYHTPYFLHVFAGSDYAAGYYSYIWSEVLARDTGQWFHTHGGISRANGDFFRAKILSRGRTQEPDVLFREFYGGPPEIGPLLEYRGLLQREAPGQGPCVRDDPPVDRGDHVR